MISTYPMANTNNCGPRPRTPTRVSASPSSPSPKRSSRASTPSQSRSPRNSVNSAWVCEQQRRIFIGHLEQWASNHDSSACFHGKISLVTEGASIDDIELGKSVRCILTNTDWTDARRQIVVRLFPPRGRDAKHSLVVRNGSGWTSAREFFTKEYFTLKSAEKGSKRYNDDCGHMDRSLQSRSEMLGDKPDDKDTVTIQPLFHPFLRLPLEVQQMILGTAAGVTGTYRPCRDRTSYADFPFRASISRNYYSRPPSAISLSTMLRISKSFNEHLVPWVYNTTDFHFELTGFTNFLWQSGPLKRAEIRHLTFQFGPMSLLHCLRWLAPDPIFELFNLPIPTNPPALRFLWRCQIQDLSRELHLAVLTIDITGTPNVDIPFVVRILSRSFGSVDNIRFKQGTETVEMYSPRLAGLAQRRSWKEMCCAWFERNRFNHQALSSETRVKTVEELGREMDRNSAFFDSRD